MRLLVVDDVEVNRFLLEEALHRPGLELFVAESGRQALRVSASERPEVVVMDVRMPDMNGLETSRRIKEESEAFTYVILLSGDSDVANESDFKRSLADRFLSKPYTLEEIRSAVSLGFEIVSERRLSEV